MKYLSLAHSLLIILFFVGCSSAKKSKEEVGFTSLLVDQTGVDFSNTLSETEYLNIITFEYFYNGGGVAVGDINNDGLPDIYFTANQLPNKLFLNKGDFTFEDITTSAGVAGKTTWTNGVTMADVNGDGLLDIYVCYSGRGTNDEERANELFINNGDLTFSEQASTYGLADVSYSTQALFLDIDADNDLDMFLLNRPTDTYKLEDVLRRKYDTESKGADRLYRNDGGRFIDISASSGIIQNGLGYGLGVTAGDLNGDGYPDIYVANDYIEPDYMYINNGNGTFTNRGFDALNHMSNFGMGVDIADINNDGLPDVFVADMAPADNYRQKTMMKPMNPDQFYWTVANGFHHQYMFNTLHLNNGDMTFSDAAQLAGVATTDWSWSPLMADFDNDGWNDLFITNGFRKEFSNKDFVKKMDKEMGAAMESSLADRVELMKDLLQDIPETKLRNFLFKNTGSLGFEDKSDLWGLNDLTFSNGAAYADLDNDGDLDLIVNNIDQPALIYRNDLPVRNALRIKLNGPKGNTSGLGAKLTIHVGKDIQYREHYLTRGYQSSMEDKVHVGLGDKQADSVVVIWPDGKRQTAFKPKGTLTMDYAQASNAKVNQSSNQLPFTLITEKCDISYRHVENVHNDYSLEVLLPHQMSMFGPALAVGDINGDSLDDFFVGGASGQSGKLFIQNKEGTFTDTFQGVLHQDAFFEDVGAEFFDIDGDGDLDVYVTSGGNEWLPGSPFYQDRLYLNDGGTLKRAKLPTILTSNSVVRPVDIDGDGDLDVFVGGRLRPMSYPLPTKSWILLNENGTYSDGTSIYNQTFEKLGMITDAQWGDLDGDGTPELVVVGEWTAIHVFSIEGKSLVDKTSDFGLSNLTGWWYSLQLADINADGKLDILAGNLGLNYKYKASMDEPFHVFYNDFDQNGRGDIVLGYHNDGNLFPLRGRQCSSEQVPALADKFKTYDQFGKATLEQVYGDKKLQQSVHYEARTFASMVLINRSGSFEHVELPRMAQLSSINDIIVHDFNGDGHVDILYAGNLYPVEIETTRNDASYGGLLLGDGTGNFDYSGAVETGFKAAGDVKHLTTIQIKNKTCILVARNSGKLDIYEFDFLNKPL